MCAELKSLWVGLWPLADPTARSTAHAPAKVCRPVSLPRHLEGNLRKALKQIRSASYRGKCKQACKLLGLHLCLWNLWWLRVLVGRVRHHCLKQSASARFQTYSARASCASAKRAS